MPEDGAFGSGPPTAQAVLLIVNIINFDPISLTMGIIALVVAQDRASRDYLEGVEILD